LNSGRSPASKAGFSRGHFRKTANWPPFFQPKKQINPPVSFLLPHKGIDFRPTDGLACIAQHGPTRDDELECLGSDCFDQACNSGWNPVPGYNESVPMTDLTLYPDANRALWSSGFPTLAPSGMSFLDGNQWGLWDNAMVVAFLKTAQLGFFRLDASGSLASVAFSPFANRLRTVEQGPDGCLYILEDVASSGRILRGCAVP
jgi:hypothetical protein